MSCQFLSFLPCMRLSNLCALCFSAGLLVVSTIGYYSRCFSNSLRYRFGIFDPAIVYDHLGEILSALVVGSLVFCVFLYLKVSFFFILYLDFGFSINTYFTLRLHSFYAFKGHVAPSSTDSGSSGNVIIDFYWVSLSSASRLFSNF